eukprot:14942-Heterococcus_DN1.PRE.7
MSTALSSDAALVHVSKVALRNQQELEFDIPYLELGFYGTPFKEMVFVQPTTYALLNVTDQLLSSMKRLLLLMPVSIMKRLVLLMHARGYHSSSLLILTIFTNCYSAFCCCLLLPGTTAMQQQPFFVVPLDDIEHVHFERVNPSGRNFDIKLILRSNVWNDGAVTEPLSINMVEQRYLHQIMNWLVCALAAHGCQCSCALSTADAVILLVLVLMQAQLIVTSHTHKQTRPGRGRLYSALYVKMTDSTRTRIVLLPVLLAVAAVMLLYVTAVAVVSLDHGGLPSAPSLCDTAAAY